MAPAHNTASVAAGFLAGTADGALTQLWYDADGRVTGTSGPENPSATGFAGTSSDYDASGHRTAFTDADGNISRTGWGPLGRMVWQENAENHATGRKTTYAYDTLGRLTRVQAPDKSPATITYHFGYQALPDGRGSWSSSIRSEPDGTTTTTRFNRGGKPITVDYSNTTASPDATYTWDDLGRLWATTFALPGARELNIRRLRVSKSPSMTFGRYAHKGSFFVRPAFGSRMSIETGFGSLCVRPLQPLLQRATVCQSSTGSAMATKVRVTVLRLMRTTPTGATTRIRAGRANESRWLGRASDWRSATAVKILDRSRVLWIWRAQAPPRSAEAFPLAPRTGRGPTSVTQQPSMWCSPRNC